MAPKYKASAELVKELTDALEKEQSNPFNSYTLRLLQNPRQLVKEYKAQPNLALRNKHGDWFYLWKNHPVKIGDDYLVLHELIEELDKLFETEKDHG